MRRGIRIIAALYIAYLALSVLVVLPALNLLAPHYVQQTFGRQLRTEIILYNPFTLSVEVRRAQLPELDGTPFANLHRAEVNLSLASLWQPGWVLDTVAVNEFSIHIARMPSGEFNFSDMLQAMPDSPETDDSDGLPGVTIGHLVFDARRISLSDAARDKPFNTHYDGLAISVNDLSTIHKDGKPYRISAVAESGGRLDWEGTVSVPAAHSSGKLTLSGLSLVPFWRFAEPWLNFELSRGSLDMRGNYEIHWNQEFSYQISETGLEIADVALIPRDTQALPDTSISLQSLGIEGVSAISTTSHATIKAVTVDGLAIAGWSEAHRVSLQEMFVVELPAAEQNPAPDDEAPGWTAAIDSSRLLNSRLQWRSEYTDPPLLVAEPISAHLEDLSWPLQGDSPLGLELTINESASLAIDGFLALDSGVGTLNYRMEDLSLPWFNPNLPAALKATITDGHVQVEGQLTLARFLPATVQMQAEINDFAGKIQGTEAAITRWDTVRWNNLQVNLNERALSLDSLLINNYAGRIHIARDGSINAQNIWQEEVGEAAVELAEDLELDKPWQVDVPEVYISDSAIDFMDESLPIPFRTVIGNLNGAILNISSAADARTKIDIKGSVDGYAPVVFSGSAVPFGKPPALNLALSFSGVDMSLLTPYSGTYAGHSIERGLLSLDLKYTLADQHLQGENDILIDQMKLGDKVESDKALDLPLALALALLTDINGVIDLSVPVSGDIDDPGFAIGSVVMSALVNLITKAVTAPFSLLANLVGSEEDLQRLGFATGSAELNDANRAKLAQLNDALTQRPGLTLIVTGRLNTAADREQLQILALDAELASAGLSEPEISGRGPDFMAAIESRYRELAGSNAGGKVPLAEQYQQVVESFPVSDAQLLQLAQDRAVAIKQQLVNELGMEADRAAINQISLDDKANIFSGVELDVES